MNEKRESSATIDRKKSIRDAVRIVTIGKNGVAYNNSQVVRGCVSADDPKNFQRSKIALLAIVFSVAQTRR